MDEVIQNFSEVFKDLQPLEVMIPHRGDVHTDHQVVFAAASACCKLFWYPSVRRISAYETLSETEFGLDQEVRFTHNVFVNINDFLETIIDLLQIYRSEIGEFPFPRSDQAVRALAQYRGANAGFKAAEAFRLVLEIM